MSSEDGSENEFKEEGPTIGTYEGGRSETGQRHGKGKNIFPNGDIYEGDYNEGKREGAGVYIWKATGARYTGSYKENLRDGEGELVFPDGSKYKGLWQKEKKHGFGTYTYANGDTYEGNWENDLKHGEGLYNFKASASKKKGTFNQGNLTGVGEILHLDHKIVGKFTSNETMEVPVKVTFMATGGYSKILHDPALLSQEVSPATPVEI
ncbi:hypothetical protein HK099_004235 [Clydaea vesicula]|uniref:Radial spoke head 1 homolog n=1 Tax=Clydaea vesicula TaxID=447962 RepID=A0AAD5XVQ7_9FUNG|nr:hypothetical protein HK099_004235 [Clydaea vesicula]KAJ3395113.1 hypothetical protein HDU92_006198 [Lobulomyces angularis]